VLNSRRRFGPMMWAPIANNLVAIAVLIAYLLAYGPASGAEKYGGFTTGQELLLGLGSTLGIVVQLLVLLPYLKAAGFTYRPRFDFRGAGLGHTLRLGVWTVLFVVVNQIAYTFVVKIASSGTAGGEPGTGYTIYSNTFLVVMVPHAIITVSLATATLTRMSELASRGDLRGVGLQVGTTMRTALALIIPFACVLPVIALPVSNLVSKYGAASDSTSDFARSLSLFAIGLVFFSCHYLVLRGFYALERNRTVFWVQCVIAAVNIALALALTTGVAPVDVAPRLILAYAGAYLVGSVVSYLLLRHILGGLDTERFLRFLVRILLAAALAALATWGVRELVETFWPQNGTKLQAIVMLGVLGLVDLTLLTTLARLMRITEVNEVVSLVTKRIRR
jgi:putative peptidoglycan lipid II flippase